MTNTPYLECNNLCSAMQFFFNGSNMYQINDFSFLFIKVYFEILPGALWKNSFRY